jgi:EmrB/QacA subfamily drug resistance transporter
MFLAALEATAVATAMPTAVSEFGSLERFSWTFSAYLLASTVTVPLYGKLADLFGRKRIFLIAIGLFLVGSILCGMAGSIGQLIAFRALQGIGAGGVIPLSITIVGDIYTLEERGRIQGLYSAVWAVSSLAGPAVGGVVTELASWRWVFLFNVPFGLLAAFLVQTYLRDPEQPLGGALDVRGTVALALASVALLLALHEGGSMWGWSDARTLIALGIALVGTVLFLREQRRSREPTLPLDLFANRVIAVASAGAVAIGTLLFCLTAFVPMYTQGVLGGGPGAAGATLVPLSLAWPLTSTLAGWMLMRAGYRPLILLGSILTLAGTILLARATQGGQRADIMIAMLVTGGGLGFMSTPYLVAVQTGVPWRRRGVATSSQQFFRTIGGAIAVALFGSVINVRLQSALGPGASAASVLDPASRADMDPAVLDAVAGALRDGPSCR